MRRDYNITIVSGSQSGDENENSRTEKKRRAINARYIEIVRESQTMINSRQYTASITHLKMAIKFNPRRYEAYLLAGIALLRLGQFAKAVDVLTQSIEINPDQNSQAYYERGCAKVKQNLPAISDFDYAIRQRPAYPEAYYQRALIYLDQVRRFACHNDVGRAEQDLMNACQLAQVQGKTTLAASCVQVLGEIRLLPKPAVSQPLSPDVFPQTAGTPQPPYGRNELTVSHEPIEMIELSQGNDLLPGKLEECKFRFFPKSVGFLLGINLLVWLALVLLLKGHSVFGDWILPLSGPWIVDFELRLDTIFSLDHAWKLFVYAFLHDPNQCLPLIVELFGLWFFGTLVVNRYGVLTFFAVTVFSIPLCAFGWGNVELLVPRLDEIGSYSGMIGPICALAGLAVLGYPRCSITLFGIIATVSLFFAIHYGYSEWFVRVLPPYSSWWLNFEMMLTGWLVAIVLGPILLIHCPKKVKRLDS